VSQNVVAAHVFGEEDPTSHRREVIFVLNVRAIQSLMQPPFHEVGEEGHGAQRVLGKTAVNPKSDLDQIKLWTKEKIDE
jgi:hypothetical protein